MFALLVSSSWGGPGIEVQVVCGNKKFRTKGQEVSWVKASKVSGRCHDYTVVDGIAQKTKQIKLTMGKLGD